jgi:DNA-binding PadR family transcriptional regulator
MVTDIRETTGVHLGPGTLYGALARLEQQRLIVPLAARGRRQPYRITAAGRRALREQLTTIEAVARVGLSRLRAAGDTA